MLRINADFPESYNSTRTNSSHAYSVALRFQTELVALYFGMASRMHMGIFFVNASQLVASDISLATSFLISFRLPGVPDGHVQKGLVFLKEQMYNTCQINTGELVMQAERK